MLGTRSSACFCRNQGRSFEAWRSHVRKKIDFSEATPPLIGADSPVLARGGRSDRASELFFSRFEMPRPKPPGHLFDLVRTKIFARFELVAQSAPDDGPVGGAILIRRKSPTSWLMRDAIVANFKLLDQDQSSNSHCACAANEFAMQCQLHSTWLTAANQSAPPKYRPLRRSSMPKSARGSEPRPTAADVCARGCCARSCHRRWHSDAARCSG